MVLAKSFLVIFVSAEEIETHSRYEAYCKLFIPFLSHFAYDYIFFF